MSAKHTPAPWNDGLHHQGHLAIQSDNGRLVALCGAMARNDEQLENLANARLIAAAPDLLNALLRIQARADYGKDNPRKQTDVLFDILELSRDVIAKAIGENA